MGECVISMDADMQHPPELLGKMLEKWKEGYDVVYTIRRDSPDTGFFKRADISKAFYLLINWLSEIAIPLGSADFRLLDRKVVDELKKFEENWLFIRGLVSWLGFRQTGIEYTAQPRFSGRSKYSLVKMVAFAMEGVTPSASFPSDCDIYRSFLLHHLVFISPVCRRCEAFYGNWLRRVGLPRR